MVSDGLSSIKSPGLAHVWLVGRWNHHSAVGCQERGSGELAVSLTLFRVPRVSRPNDEITDEVVVQVVQGTDNLEIQTGSFQ